MVAQHAIHGVAHLIGIATGEGFYASLEDRRTQNEVGSRCLCFPRTIIIRIVDFSTVGSRLPTS
jgi:hypothetical protein